MSKRDVDMSKGSGVRFRTPSLPIWTDAEAAKRYGVSLAVLRDIERWALDKWRAFMRDEVDAHGRPKRRKKATR